MAPRQQEWRDGHLPVDPVAQKQPVCAYDGAVSSTHHWDFRVFDGSGRRYFRVERDPSVITSPRAVWHETAILSWLSCEQNVHHFITETLGPVLGANGSDGIDITGAHIIITSPAFWPHPSPDHCVGNRFLWLLNLLPTSKQIFLARSNPGSKVNVPPFLRMPPSRVYSAESGRGETLAVPHCFKRVLMQKVVSGWGHVVPASRYRQLAERSSMCQPGRGYTLFIQRLRSRRIVNEDEVVAALKRRFGLPVVVASFENRTVQEQLSLACGARVFLGAQGMAMEWAHFLNGASHSGLAIELSWPGWPCYYKLKMETSGLWGMCLMASSSSANAEYSPSGAPTHREHKRSRQSRSGKNDNVYLNASIIDHLDARTGRSAAGIRPGIIARAQAAIEIAARSYRHDR